MSNDAGVVLVTGATGNQGGGVARALRKAGRPVRAFVRNPEADAAKALAAVGCEIAVGSFEDAASLASALDGASAVFSVQRPDLDNSNSEQRHGFALIDAAKAARVTHFVHSSVCQLDDHQRFPRWANALLGRRSLETCALPEVIDEACEPFCDGENIVKRGPACLLPAVSCVPLVLALHELCTNAVKHGSLSVPEGRVGLCQTNGAAPCPQ